MKTKDKVIGIKLDTDRDNIVRAYADMNTGGKITPAIRQALDFFFARIRIEEYIAASVHRNMQRFSDIVEFAMWCDSEGKTPARPIQIHSPWSSRTVARYIIRETYRSLEELHAANFESSFLELVILQREHWLPGTYLNEEIPFPEHETPAPAPAPKRKATARRKAEATA